MTTKEIVTLLDQALLHDGKMHYRLYEEALEGLLGDLKASLKQDKEDFIFVVTEDDDQVAMVLIEKSGKVYINEKARQKLKSLWRAAYDRNLKQFIPLLAQQLEDGELAVTGVGSPR